MLSRVASSSCRLFSSPLVKNRVLVARLGNGYATAPPPASTTQPTGIVHTIIDPAEYAESRNKYDPLLVFHAPGVAVIEEIVVDTVEECRNDECLADQLRVRFGENMPTIEDDKKSGRDLVNFPRPEILENPEGTRLIIIPESWFKFFYEKTGVSGPYALTGGLLTFLLSKEWLILEHEMLVGATLSLIMFVGLKTWGKQLSDYLEDIASHEVKSWDTYQQGTIKVLDKYIELEKKHQNSLKGQSVLFDAKRENIHLQREAEYRRRLMSVHNEVKRKLDYQIATQNASKSFSQKHMVNWIIDNVVKGISTQQEKEALSKCIADLKSLSVKRAGVI